MRTIAGQTLLTEMVSSVHIPEIYQVKELINIAIFRNPEDAIASLINKQLEFNPAAFDIKSVPHSAERAFSMYRKYFKYATQNSENIYIVDFEKAVADTPQEIKKIANTYGLRYRPGMENFTMNDIKFTDDLLWKDKYDGHIPRPKDEVRLIIEEAVSNLSFIEEANDMHQHIMGLAS